MASYRLSELAVEDLRLISATTIEEWGPLQAKKYISLLHEAMVKAADAPDIGRNRPELFESAQSFPAQKHVFDYWKTNEGIEVARILHQRMDVGAAFE